MARWGMVIDLDLCTGCGSCAAACKSENNVAYVSPEEAKRGRTLTWLMVLYEREEKGERALGKEPFFPNLCMHCDNPPCTKVCPVHATYLAEEGLVAQIYDRCIGCRYCMAACPYTVKCFNWKWPQWPDSYRQGFNPDVSVRPAGVVEKCTFCHHRLQASRDTVRAEGRELRDSDYQPACVESCPARAMTFGDLDDRASEVARRAADPRADRLLDHLGSAPKVVYLRSRDRRIDL